VFNYLIHYVSPFGERILKFVYSFIGENMLSMKLLYSMYVTYMI